MVCQKKNWLDINRTGNASHDQTMANYDSALRPGGRKLPSWCATAECLLFIDNIHERTVWTPAAKRPEPKDYYISVSSAGESIFYIVSKRLCEIQRDAPI